MELSARELESITNAIRKLQQDVQWKPGKDTKHLETRKNYGHLPFDATMADYNGLVKQIITDSSSNVYGYVFDETLYVGVMGSVESRQWLVIFSQDGIMETAFPPELPTEYITRRGMIKVGQLKEVMR